MPADVEALPSVSVIVRTRNRPALLTEALRDIDAQEFQDFEVVVVDDGDDPAPTRAAVAAVPRLADRVRVIDRTTLEHGRALAANAGVKAARTEFLVLHDDDDTWSNDFLAVTTAHLRAHPEIGGVSAHTEVVIHRTDEVTGEERLERLLLNPSLTAITIADMVKENRVTTHSLLYRASVHDEIGYLDEDLVAHEDWDLYLRFLSHFPIDLLPFPARAFWHHRPEATGDEGNSVFTLDSDHDAARVKVRDRHLRASVARDGLGPALHLAAEMRSLEAELKTQRGEIEALHNDIRDLRTALTQSHAVLERIDARGEPLDDRIERVETTVGQIAPLILERTSVGSFVRRARRLLKR